MRGSSAVADLVRLYLQRLTGCILLTVAKHAHSMRPLANSDSPRKALIPKAHWFGTECGKDVMVLDLLGPSLAKIMEHTGGGTFPLAYVVTAATHLVRYKTSRSD